MLAIPISSEKAKLDKGYISLPKVLEKINDNCSATSPALAES